MSLKHTLYENYKKVYNKFSNVKLVSDFESSGRLTAKEFVEAGDELIAKIPVWQWVGGSDTVQPYLPRNKKCLVYKGAPCIRRVNEFNGTLNVSEEDVDGFIVTSQLENSNIKKISLNNECSDQVILTWEEDESDYKHNLSYQKSPAVNTKESKRESSNEIFQNSNACANELKEHKVETEEVSEESDIEAMKEGVDVNTSRRLYDVYITYDKYYETPRMYLVGYASDHITPLTTEQMKEDIYLANYGKTVTIDSHPVLGFPCISIHPCRHAETMRELMKRMKSKQLSASSLQLANQSVTFPPQMALFLFLKFISTVVPTIEYDVTSGVDIEREQPYDVYIYKLKL